MNSSALLSCLRSLPAAVLFKTFGTAYSPAVDGVSVLDQPMYRWAHANWTNQVPVIIGHNYREGKNPAVITFVHLLLNTAECRAGALFAQLYTGQASGPLSPIVYNNVVATIEFALLPQATLQLGPIFSWYQPELTATGGDYYATLVSILGDSLVVCGTDEISTSMSLIASPTAPVYRYYLVIK